MVFMNGRGRPPIGSPEIGTVRWEEKHFCFIGSNGFYWHGTKFGGWQKEPPEMLPENRKRPATSGRGRRPNGNERIGLEVTYNGEHDCYQTDKKYYWHGTFEGGWKKYPPGGEHVSDDEEDNLSSGDSDSDRRSDCSTDSNKRRKRGNTKGRPPRRKSNDEVIKYDTERLCWKTDRDGGLYWHGTYKGGWKKFPPKKRSLAM